MLLSLAIGITAIGIWYFGTMSFVKFATNKEH